MTVRRRNASIATLACLAAVTLGSATTAQAGPPFRNIERVIRQVERVVGGHPYPNPSPHPCPLPVPVPHPIPRPCPTPAPFPQPIPQPAPQPIPQPAPQPAPGYYYFGALTSTVPVGQAGEAPSGPQVRVVPGYGEQVYGQRVNSIDPDSPAFHAGLELGDIILNANGYAMDSDQDLQAAVSDSQGYLEMQVLDIRSGQIVWVVAEPEAQGSATALVNPAQFQSGAVAPPRNPPRTFQDTGRPNIDSKNSSTRASNGRRPPSRRR